MTMLIKTINLSLTYKDANSEVIAVDNVSLELPEKGFFGILGPSGSGKTSLLYLLSGIRQPSHGEIYFSEKVYPKSSEGRSLLRRLQMGFVFQQHFLINYLNVKQNIRIGASKEGKDADMRVQNIIQRLGLEGFELRKPYELSGGQRQRVAIGRALANEAKVIFVDEPTAALDHHTGRKVVDYLYELAKDTCVVTVTHDDSILNNADKIFTMWDGALTEGNTL
ncbi:ABC transporter ATP-binding protein [candidate division WWE3 bacterium CG_4_9_14_3_um_filter_41_6]|uniref:ABC transporter ATP-binding protein n=1 Tax=candidate division WWE3 bacterium CG_4_10_14_0_2_um_filter_41_14 TaxID=1975072 RepID=A0A2M7TF59_UNCKA|nr:MAG: ABC transporter ATP-binding protein [candidate division WWE3 bacterium CG_4_10_14_0_2_um_filter_41_14]PJA38734.1 MAG: ABC transporter ATP-binding protein [candidate division WWE3 bacterium CG_4_9_14_3_um_filter_41_6]